MASANTPRFISPATSIAPGNPKYGINKKLAARIPTAAPAEFTKYICDTMRPFLSGILR